MKGTLQSSIGTSFNPLPTRRPGGTPRRTTPSIHSYLFQSAPDPKAGRNGTGAGMTSLLYKFQSAPDPKAGRNGRPAARSAAMARFQSAPDPKAGRNGRGGRVHDGAWPVSIRSRPEGREERPPPSNRSGALLFQSAPDPKAGRNRPRHQCRTSARQFQSAPDPKAGRNSGSCRLRTGSIGFNPLPTRRPGGTGISRSCSHELLRFNPLPTRRPGGTRDSRPATRRQLCFNPLPTRRPGGTADHADFGRVLSVSIRSRPEGREEPGSHGRALTSCYVSIRSRPEGREELGIPGRPRDVSSVSIRSRPEGREERLLGVGFNHRPVVSIRSRPEGREEPIDHRAVPVQLPFQSAPDPKAGRNLRSRRLPGRQGKFQSAPDPKAGRNERDHGLGIGRCRVSIRSRPEGREELGVARVHHAAIDGFNPLPTRRPGGTGFVLGEPAGLDVSIRSRPEGREEPCGHRHRSSCRRFQSAPDPKAGRNGGSHEGHGVADGFNPLPTRRPGGTSASILSMDGDWCFNPLPTRRPGGTPGLRRWTSGRTVSIRSRPEGREERPRSRGGPPGRSVSIRSRPEGREEHVTILIRVPVEVLFQSAPDPKAGRNFAVVPVDAAGNRFNPLPTRRPGGTAGCES